MKIKSKITFRIDATIKKYNGVLLSPNALNIPTVLIRRAVLGMDGEPITARMIAETHSQETVRVRLTVFRYIFLEYQDVM